MKILFDYSYLKEFIEYKRHYKLFNFISVFIYIFFLENYLNISYYFNGKIYNSKFLRKIENKVELKIESYF